MLGADADGVLLVRQGDATTQMACYRLSHVFDPDNTLYPLQPSYQISAIGRSFAKLQKDLQHQTILFLIALYVQRFYLYAVKGQITGNIGYGTGAIGSNDADKLAVAAVVGSKTLFPGMKGNQSYHVIMVATLLRKYIPLPAARPIAETIHKLAAVVRPRIVKPSCRMVPAPRKPMPLTTWLRYAPSHGVADILLQLGSLRIDIIKAVKRNEHKQRRAHAHKNMCTKTGRAVTTASFYTDNTAENCGNNQPDNHNNLFVMQKEVLIKSMPVSPHSFRSLPAPGADTGTDLFYSFAASP